MFDIASIHKAFRRPTTNVAFCLASLCSMTAIATEAPTGFDNKTNGFIKDQAEFDKDRETFEEVETIDDGLGPVYNATSCVSCHQNPVSGSSSQIPEIRAGHLAPDPNHPEQITFVEHPGGSLVHQRAIDATIQEHVLVDDAIRTLRMSTNVLGNGFVECIRDHDLIAAVDKQRHTPFGDLRGTIVLAPVAISLDASKERVGRFGWKSQHASLLNFSADAYINEMGITSPLQPKENSSNGADVSKFDKVPDPEDEADANHPFGKDVEAFTRFMRSTKAPARNADGDLKAADLEAGEKLFRDKADNGKKTGCAICHVPDWNTLPVGHPLPGNFPDNKVPEALGGKTIHPFSDFLLHDVGTGDGIVQTQHAQFPPRSAQKIEKMSIPVTPESEGKHVLHLLSEGGKIQVQENRRCLGGDLIDTASMIRTAPLWGLRVRPQLLHDGSALTIDEAIRKHRGQAEKVRLNYEHVLTQEERNQLLAFLSSL